MGINIVFCDEQDRIKNCGFDENKIQTIVKSCLESEMLEFDCEVGVTFTDNEGIRKLNYEHRDIDKETDVLSFPMIDDVACIGEFDINPENGMVYLGDIVISLEKADEQAKDYGHSFEREVSFLIVHSMMHLLGYDHMEEEEKKEEIKKFYEYCPKAFSMEKTSKLLGRKQYESSAHNDALIAQINGFSSSIRKYVIDLTSKQEMSYYQILLMKKRL